MSLSEQIFINKQFLEDLNSLCELKLFKAQFSLWGYYPEETLDKIVSKDYLVDTILKSSVNPTVVDTIIEDDLVSLLVPDISLNNWYSIVLFYDKTTSDGEFVENVPAAVMYTQSRSDTTVLPLVSFAENRIYFDLRSLPLRAHLNTFMSPYMQENDVGESIKHAPSDHRHKTRIMGSSADPNYDQDSYLADIGNLNKIMFFNTSTYCDYATNNVISKLSGSTSIGLNGDFLQDYLPPDIDTQDFYRNVVGCAKEWSEARLCSEDLIDGWPVQDIDSMPVIGLEPIAVDFPSDDWGHSSNSSSTNYDTSIYHYFANITDYTKLSLRFVDEGQEAIVFDCYGMDTSPYGDRIFKFNRPAEGVYTTMELQVATDPRYLDVRLYFQIASDFRTNYPTSSTFASKYFDASTYKLKEGCSVAVLINPDA